MVDPRHPLFGRRFPLHSHSRSPQAVGHVFVRARRDRQPPRQLGAAEAATRPAAIAALRTRFPGVCNIRLVKLNATPRMDVCEWDSLEQAQAAAAAAATVPELAALCECLGPDVSMEHAPILQAAGEGVATVERAGSESGAAAGAATGSGSRPGAPARPRAGRRIW